MRPLWKLRSGQFVGWRTEDDQLYGADGVHLGYFVDDMAYTNDGRAIGELYGHQRLGRREDVIYPTGARETPRGAKAVAAMGPTTGLPVAGWTDPEL